MELPYRQELCFSAPALELGRKDGIIDDQSLLCKKIRHSDRHAPGCPDMRFLALSSWGIEINPKLAKDLEELLNLK
jgi:hypothetical protein